MSKHTLAIVLALLVSLITAFPQLILRFEPYYQGIEMIPDSPWSARVREIQDGNGFGSIYYKDGKSDPYLHLPFGSEVVAYMGKGLGLDINNSLLLSRLVLSFAAFLLIYCFAMLLSGSRLASLSSASVILLAESMLDYSGLTVFLKEVWGGQSPTSFLEISRPVYSLMIFVPFFAFLASFYQFYKTRKVFWGAISALILGSSFYNYLYLWTYLYAFGGILVLIYLWKKNWREALRLSWVFIAGAVLAIPYGLNLYRASLHPLYEELGKRHGIVYSHAPLFIGSLAFIALVLYFLMPLWRKDGEKNIFAWSLLLAPVITMNQQLISGQVLQTGHYHWYFHKPIAVIFILAAIFSLLWRLNRRSFGRILAALVIATSFAIGIFVQAASYLNDIPNRDGGYVAQERQRYGPVMDWLNLNAPSGAVVLANNEASQVTAIYTPLNLFYHRSAQLFFSATEERLLEALFTFYSLRGVGEKEAREVFKEEIKRFSADVYGIYYREVHGSYGAIPDEKFEEIISRYSSFLRVPLTDTLHKYEVEYIIWDKIKDPEWRLDRLGFLKKEADFGRMAIYSVRP